ncbi:G-type lectin S-receptor-like serine/threonine-protein kinase LECRK2 [Apium graveolens]|uniref:G-type lectin S-receptor-like serine/threonine-protein kinase LECRK2 n=1 Tax=Apium graveolens TaxID=4045 RepID=UPI003D7AD4EB
MANSHFILLLLLFAICCVAAQQRRSSKIGQGSFLTLAGNSSWLSPSGLFAFGFYQQKINQYRIGIFLAGFPLNKTVVWTANRNDPFYVSGSTLRLTTDGRLVVEQQTPNSITIADIVKLDQSISSASMLDSGNFVLYNSSQEMIWQSFDHPTDTILPGQILSNGQELFSSMSESDHSTGIFRLKMQSDSNLVLYPVNTMDTGFNAYWGTNTYGGINVTLNLDPDGRLYLLSNHSAFVLYNTSQALSKKEIYLIKIQTALSKKEIYLIKIQTDGFLYLYLHSLDQRSKNSSIAWKSSWRSSQDECVPKGLCGNNGYCILINNTIAKCECPVGFQYVNRTVGCQRNNDYSVEDCKNKEKPFQFNMEQLNSVTWENEPYPVHKRNSREDCKTDCLNDCECDAAFFKNGLCFQVKLPLRYGRKVPTDPIVGYIKLASPTHGNKKRNNTGQQSVVLVLTAGSPILDASSLSN